MQTIHFSQIDSTNSVAKFLLAAGVASPIPITASRQTAGRGSHGRQWMSDDVGGFYYSLALSPFFSENHTNLTIQVAESCQRVIASLWGHAVDIEWPNDLIISGKKMGGILVETVGGGKQGGAHGIIGIGLNINQRQFPELLRPVAISLFQLDGIDRSLELLKSTITKELLGWL